MNRNSLLRILESISQRATNRNNQNQGADSQGQREDEEEENEMMIVDPETLTMSRIYRSIYLQRSSLSSSRTQLRRDQRRGLDDDEDESQGIEPDSDEDYKFDEENDKIRQIRLSYDLPPQWKEIEEDNSDTAVEIYNQLGPLAVLLYKRISSLKILSGLNSGTLSFLKPVLDYYEALAKKFPKDSQSATKLKQLMGIVPSLKQLRKGMLHRQPKEHIVYKIVIDVSGHYLKEFDGPDFKNYKNRFLPMAIQFYESLTNEEMHKIADTLRLFTNVEIQKLLQFKATREDYLRYYDKELLAFSNSSAATRKSKYIM